MLCLWFSCSYASVLDVQYNAGEVEVSAMYDLISSTAPSLPIPLYSRSNPGISNDMYVARRKSRML